MENDRRLGERILHALELAIDQEDLETAELLARALELALTRFGGPGAIEKRDPPTMLDMVFSRLDELRRASRAA